MSEQAPQPIEDTIDAIIDAVAIIDDVELEGVQLQRFIQDLAQGIYSNLSIAKRYGFETLERMGKYLQEHPEVVKRIKQHKAVWQSDGNVAEATRLEASYGVRELLPHFVAKALDPKTTDSIQVDILKQLSRNAGIDGAGAGGKPGQAAAGNQLTFNIKFSNGREETIATTVVEQAPAIEGPAA